MPQVVRTSTAPAFSAVEGAYGIVEVFPEIMVGHRV